MELSTKECVEYLLHGCSTQHYFWSSHLNNQSVLEIHNIHKHYGGIHALNGINLQVCEGEVCALVGENGAGKSTLIKILTGVESLDEGEIILDGQAIKIHDPIDARVKGITAIYQECSLINNLSIAQNIMLGHEPGTGFLGWNNNKALFEETRTYLDKFEINLNPKTQVGNLGIGEKRIVEILKALSLNARILLLDEPTTGMSKMEIDSLFKIMQDLKKHHVTMIYISHHLEEVFQVCERIYVFRDGQNAGTFNVAEVDKPTLIKAMIGKNLSERSTNLNSFATDKTILEAKELLGVGMSSPISFKLKAGEILGITGIIGAGKTEVGRALFGVSKVLHGELEIDGKKAILNSPRAASNFGIGYIPEDRKSQGLFLFHPMEVNITIADMNKSCRLNTFINFRKRRSISEKTVEELHIVPTNIKMNVQNLSGGNQQKVVLGKWLVRSPKIFILDEPTRGVDVGAKSEIYALVHSLAENGSGVILLSSEFDEVTRVCDRIIVLRHGKIMGELPAVNATSEKLLSLSLGE